jgi:hypothetical protein
MAKHDIQMVRKASGKLFQLLVSPKDVVDEKAGEYEMQCQTYPRSAMDRRDEALTTDSRSIC